MTATSVFLYLNKMTGFETNTESKSLFGIVNTKVKVHLFG